MRAPHEADEEGGKSCSTEVAGNSENKEEIVLPKGG